MCSTMNQNPLRIEDHPAMPHYQPNASPYATSTVRTETAWGRCGVSRARTTMSRRSTTSWPGWAYSSHLFGVLVCVRGRDVRSFSMCSGRGGTFARMEHKTAVLAMPAVDRNRRSFLDPHRASLQCTWCFATDNFITSQRLETVMHGLSFFFNEFPEFFLVYSRVVVSSAV